MKWPVDQSFRFRRELALFRSYIKSMNVSFERLHQELDERIDTSMKSAEGEEKEYAHQQFANEVFELHADFPRIQSTTLFVALFTLLEDQLDIICLMRQKECKFVISVKDLKDIGIEASKTYLTKVCGVAFPSDTNEWQQIKDYQRLRNAIAHARGYVRPEDTKLKEFLMKHKADVYDTWSDLSLSTKFLLDAADVLDRFMERVASSIPTQLTCHQLSAPR